MGNLVTNIEISDHTKKCIEDYLRSQGISPESFHGKISENDEMYHNAIAVNNPDDFAYFKYIESGRRTNDVMKQIYDHFFGGPENVDSILEFASGHGRATRYMIHSVPVERFWVSDIYSDAMAFQRSYFKVNAVQSVEDPEKFNCEQKFSLITAMSLFSHLPENLFEGWLSKLGSLLADDGILAISTREAGMVRGTPSADEASSSGILFERQSESDSLSTDIYGLTAVTNNFVRKKIEKCISPDANVQMFERGLYLNQNLYIISNRKLDKSKPFTLNRPPTGGKAPKWVTLNSGQQVYFRGWAVDLNVGSEIEAVDVFVDGEAFGKAQLGDYRNEAFKTHFPGLESRPVSWECRLDTAQCRPDSIVKFRIRSGTGASVEYYAPPLEL